MQITKEKKHYRFTFYFGGRNVTGTAATHAQAITMGYSLFVKLKQ